MSWNHAMKVPSHSWNSLTGLADASSSTAFERGWRNRRRRRRERVDDERERVLDPARQVGELGLEPGEVRRHVRRERCASGVEVVEVAVQCRDRRGRAAHVACVDRGLQLAEPRHDARSPWCRARRCRGEARGRRGRS